MQFGYCEGDEQTVGRYEIRKGGLGDAENKYLPPYFRKHSSAATAE